MIKSLWANVQMDAVRMRKINGWLAVLWIFPGLPVAYLLRQSVPFLVGISVYAVVTGHWSTWQAARVEVRQEEIAEEQR